MKLKVFMLTVLLYIQTLVAYAANIPLMPVNDLRPGMQGVGKTVIQGDTIEEFNVEIIGVTGKETTGYSILVRLYGDLIDKTGGVAQGMSGSPVYIDGRLVGAVAYGRSFNDPHYCFLTPIGSMLKMLDTPQKQHVDWIPKGTALTAGGFTEMGLEILKNDLKERGLDVVMGINSGEESTKPLEPGSSVGASLMSGDMTLGALGTVTWTDDKGHILAFGHPFMSRGDSNFFMNRAWVLGVIPNMQSAYKIGNIGTEIGKIHQDRSSGIAGLVGVMPKSLPLVINVNDTSRGISNTTRARVIEDEQLVPAIVNAATVSCVNRTVDRNCNGTAKLQFKVTGVDKNKKYLELDRENMYYATDGLEKGMVQELVEALKIFMNNKFEKLDVYGINVDVEITDAVQVAEIVKVSTNAKNIHPGDVVPLNVVMKPFRGEEFTRKVDFTVPKKHNGGKLVLNIHGGSSVSWIVNLLRKQKDEGAPESKKEEKKKTLEDFVKDFNSADKNNSLIIDITAGMKGLNGTKNDASLSSMLKGSPYKKTVPFDFIIDGEVELVLSVDK